MKALDLCKSLAASILLAMVFTFISCSSGDDDGGGGGVYTFTDKGNDIANYKTVKIGEQTWMAENLNYKVAGSKCYHEDLYPESEVQANCDKYGRLYDWKTAKTVCPSGWHLPSNDDWEQLINYVENNKECTYCAAAHLKAKSGWTYCDPSSGIWGSLCEDTFGFSAMPGSGGSLSSSGSYSYLISTNDAGYWWSASEYDSINAYYKRITYNWPLVDGGYEQFGGWSPGNKNYLFSVRCVKD